MSLKLDFGALSATLYRQLCRQGFVMREGCAERLDHLQRDADDLTRLMIRNVLTDSVVTVARRKLVRRVCALVRTRAMPAERIEAKAIDWKTKTPKL